MSANWSLQCCSFSLNSVKKFIFYSLSKAEKLLLRKSSVSVVSSKWLEDSIKSDRRLAEDPYKLQLTVADELIGEG